MQYVKPWGLAQEDRGALPALLALTEHSLPVLRAKAIVALAVLCRGSPPMLLAACEARLGPTVERLARADDTYIRYALKALSDVVVADLDQLIADVRCKRPSHSLFPDVPHLHAPPLESTEFPSIVVICTHQMHFLRGPDTPPPPGRDLRIPFHKTGY